MSVKLCRLCKRFTPGDIADPDEDLRGRCSVSFIQTSVALVGGEVRSVPHETPDAGASRSMADGCGVEARWWQPIPKPPAT